MKYQYRTEQVRGDPQRTLNDLGDDDWELLQVVQRGATSILYLKREPPLIETFRESSEAVERMKKGVKPLGRPRGSKNKPK